MSDILEEASSLVECKVCPWYKSCVMPMRFSPEDLMREMQKFAPGTGTDQNREQDFRNLIMSMASTLQNTLLEGCPVFVRRLKSGPKLAEQLKKIMQSWGDEE